MKKQKKITLKKSLIATVGSDLMKKINGGDCPLTVTHDINESNEHCVETMPIAECFANGH